MHVAVAVEFNHVGITVSNLEKTCAFLEDAFGLKVAMILDKTGGPTSSVALGLPEHRQRIALVAVSDVILELIEFIPTRRTEYDGRQDDVGYCYPSFSVDDLDVAYAELTAKGYHIHAKPHAAGEGVVAGTRFMILKDPDGKNIELVEISQKMSVGSLHQLAATTTPSFDDPVMLAD
jgi:catechol 2,3-dioxygenase-like lactoylglutathione lyase family enzyme